MTPDAAEPRTLARRQPRARAALHHAGIVLASAAALVVGGLSSPGAASAHAAAPATRAAAGPHARDFTRACAVTTVPGRDYCMTLIRTNVAHRSQISLGPDQVVGFGYGPSDLQSAYNLPSSTAGSGETVAVVDAYDDPNAQADLNTYRSDWGLPACGSGCFSKVNQNGQTSPLPSAAGSTGWDVEESLDIDMVSAICPNCHIVLVEANSPTTANLGTAVNSAVSLGAMAVSNSYGGSESSSDPTYDTDYYNHPGVAVTASAGDSGYGVSYPAASRYVTSVGGTSLNTSSNSRGWTESVWSTSSTEGTGAGCSADDAKPSWQTDTGCSNRTDNDVSAVADPNTGLAVYDSYSQGGWLEVGGTSASSPIVASVFALAGTPAAGTYPSSYIYQHTSNLYDVTTGSLGSCSPAYLCTAEVGYDGPTGWGTPNGTTAFSNGSTANTVTVTNPGNQTSTVGTAVSLQIQASDSASGQTLTYSATGLPAGLSISSTTGLITGTPTTAGSSTVTVKATDTTGAFGTATFTWTVNSTTGNTVTVTNPGNQTSTVGTAVSLQIQASDSASGQTLTYSATGLPAGLSISSTTGLITGTPTTAGSFSVTVKATDTTGAFGTATFTWTVNGGTGCTARQLLGNPGFETGAIAPWHASSGVLANTSEGVPAHSGSWLAWLDGYASPHTDTLSQSVTIPSTCNNATFSFWLDVNTDDPTGAVYDTLKLQVLNSSGTVLSTLHTYSNETNTNGGYEQFSFSVASYIGQTITLKFIGKETLTGYNTSFFIDDNALNVS